MNTCVVAHESILIHWLFSFLFFCYHKLITSFLFLNAACVLVIESRSAAAVNSFFKHISTSWLLVPTFKHAVMSLVSVQQAATVLLITSWIVVSTGNETDTCFTPIWNRYLETDGQTYRGFRCSKHTTTMAHICFKCLYIFFIYSNFRLYVHEDLEWKELSLNTLYKYIHLPATLLGMPIQLLFIANI